MRDKAQGTLLVVQGPSPLLETHLVCSMSFLVTCRNFHSKPRPLNHTNTFVFQLLFVDNTTWSASHSQLNMSCESCNRQFVSWNAAYQHMNALGHWAKRYECQSCYDDFSSQEKCNDHMDDFDHWLPTYECEGCNDRFTNAQAVRQHMARFNHFRQYYCSDCDKGFQNDNNLQQVR